MSLNSFRARYDGVQRVHPFAMTMYNCDLIAKAYASAKSAVEEYDLEIIDEAVAPKP